MHDSEGLPHRNGVKDDDLVELVMSRSGSTTIAAVTQIMCTSLKSYPKLAEWKPGVDPQEFSKLLKTNYNVGVCRNKKCEQVKVQLDKVAPPFDTNDRVELTPWREWALTIQSCRIAQGKDNNMANEVTQVCAAFIHYLRFHPQPSDFLGPSTVSHCDLMYWLASASPVVKMDPETVQKIVGPTTVMIKAVNKLSEGCPGNVCPHRLWNLGMACSRRAMELIPICSAVDGVQLSKHHLDHHAQCTVQSCLKKDENTTNVPQLHLCKDQKCPTETIPIENLNSVERFDSGVTAWSIQPQNLITKSNSPLQKYLGANPYMAVSHVWSDGTGVGLKRPGEVNMCLLRYFEEIARENGCEGIWWDTICLPMDKNKRTKALNNMHINYREAKFTLIHDLELTDLTWKNDGSPCLALALSTWFSRGWTALELRSSRTVYVMFKDSAGNQVLKDLDSEILVARDDALIHPAYRAISEMMRGLRPGGYELGRAGPDSLPLQHLLGVLRPRHTCWTRDRIIIAALFASEIFGDNMWFNSHLNTAEITKQILRRFGRLNSAALFHDQLPICSSGPWSWCPPSVFDLRDSVTNTTLEELDIIGDKLAGNWPYVVLDNADKATLRPFSAHEFLTARILSALESPSDHLLLLPIGRQLDSKDVPFLLVKRLSPRRRSMECRFVGTVIGSIIRLKTGHQHQFGARILFL